MSLSKFNTDYVKLPKDNDIYIYSEGGGRTFTAKSFLQLAGNEQKFIIMKGGMTQIIKEEYSLALYTEEGDDDELNGKYKIIK